MKAVTIPASLVTRDLEKLTEETENIYKTVAIIAERAKQISTQTKEELNTKLADFASTVDNLEEVHENREQIEISRYYERLPKPTTFATEEFLDGEMVFRYKNEDELEREAKQAEEKKQRNHRS